MIFHSAFSVFMSLCYAALYGLVFALLSLLFAVFIRIVPSFFRMASMSLSYDEGIFSAPREIFIEKGTKKSIRAIAEINACFKVIIFFMGFYLLSYGALDGEIRIYMLLTAVATYLTLKPLFLGKPLSIFLKIISVPLSYFVVFLRIFLYIPTRVFKRVKNVCK